MMALELVNAREEVLQKKIKKNERLIAITSKKSVEDGFRGKMWTSKHDESLTDNGDSSYQSLFVRKTP